MNCRKDRWFPRATVSGGTDLVTAAVQGEVNAFTAVANLVLTSDGVTAGGVWQLIQTTNITPGAINTTLQTNGAGTVVWAATPGIALVTALVQGEVNAFTAAPNLVLQSDGATAGGVWRNYLELPAAGYVQLGLAAGSGAGSAAGAGTIRQQDDVLVAARNAADTVDRVTYRWDGADNLFVGGAFGALFRPGILSIDGTTTRFLASGTTHLEAAATGINYAHFAAAGYARVGLAPGSGAGSAASAGDIRTQGGARNIIVARNNADTGDTNLISTDATDQHVLGGVRVGLTSGELYSTTGILTLESTAGAPQQRITATSNRIYQPIEYPSAGYASQGDFRVDKDWALVARNNAGTGDVAMVWMAAASDLLTLGGVFGTTARPSQITIDPQITLALKIANATKLNVTAATITGNPTTNYDFQVGGATVLAVNAAGATVTGKLTVTGLIDPTGLVVDEQATVPGGVPAAGKATFWVKDDTPNTAYFTDDGGTDHQLGLGGIWSYRAAGIAILTADPTNGVLELGLQAGSGAGSASSVGTIRFQSSFIQSFRNLIDTTDYSAIGADGSYNIHVGGTLGGSRPPTVIMDGTNGVYVRAAGANIISATAAGVTTNATTFQRLQIAGATELEVLTATVDIATNALRMGGATAASQGIIRVEKDGSIIARNNAGTGDVSMLWMGAADDNLYLGGVYGTAARPAASLYDCVDNHQFRCNGSLRFQVLAATVNIQPTTTINLKINAVTQASADSEGLYAERNWKRKHHDITAADSPYAVVDGYSVLDVDCSGGAVTVNLPAVAGEVDRVLVIKDHSGDAAANNITVDGNGAETIDGALTATIVTNYGAITLHCDGVEWSVQ